MKLPIELIPNTDPPKFKWTRRSDSIIGEVEATHEGSVPSHLEEALVALIRLTVCLKKENEHMCNQLIKCKQRCDELSKPESKVPTPSSPASVPKKSK